MRDLKDRVFLLLVVLTTVAFLWILWPFSGAILWAVVLAILFAGLQRRLSKLLKERRSLAALLTEVLILLLVIVPLMWIVAALAEEAGALYRRIESGQLDLGRALERVADALPSWATNWLDRRGMTDLSAVRERLSDSLVQISEFIARRIVSMGQSTVAFGISLFVMLYLLFFLLRDGDELSRQMRTAIPLRAEQKRALFDKFATSIRATIKGSLVIAIVQGALGGLIFWLLGVGAPVLWGVLMAVLSLLPMVGSALVWAPVALYFLASGDTVKGVVLLAYGIAVISLIDNILRPMLVGKDAKMPDYLVLLSTLGGVAIIGANGFLVGPIVAAMFIAVWHIMGEEQRVLQP